MVLDFLKGCLVSLVLSCSSESPGMDASSDVLIGPDTPMEAATVDSGPDTGQDGGVTTKDAADERVVCELTGLIPDAQSSITCTGSNWYWTNVQNVEQAPCSNVVCPMMNNYGCKYNGTSGTVCCPGFNCK